jgi:formate hydrogenlyase subunit 3/multisubunit Na+/H+ antiporter MnhD subunit
MLWAAAIILPFVAAFAVLDKRFEGSARQIICAASAAPALAIALFAPDGSGLILSWLLLGTVFGLDPLRRIFLFFTVILWVAAGVYAGSYLPKNDRQRVFYFFFLLTMSGNIGLVLAEDIASFYAFFALMTFAAYGLVVYDRTERARRAGFVYIAMAIIGEAFLLAAIFAAVATSGSTLMSEIRQTVATATHGYLVLLCTFIGFGVKAGALALHMWLPLAHPVAPTPASAVLSGAMIKAGLLGWLNLFPIGSAAMPLWSALLILLGIAGAFYAVIVGLGQDEPKTTLAYSSVSQMGLMTVGVGLGLAAPEARANILAVVALYALGHALAKGVLFLGVGIAAASAGSRRKEILALAGLVIAATAIAGGPYTGGAMAKKGLKMISPHAPGLTAPLLDWALPLSAVGTTLLLGRFLLLIWHEMRRDPGHRYGAAIWWSWGLLLSLVITGSWFVVPYYQLPLDLPTLRFAEAWEALWPILLGAVLLMSAVLLLGQQTFPYRMPPGDMLIWFERFGRRLGAIWHRSRISAPDTLEINIEPYVRMFVESERKQNLMNRAERALKSWNIAGVVFLALVLTLMGLMFAV